MNILMFTKSLCMDGVTTCVIEFANLMSRKGHRVFVCGLQGTENYRLDKAVTFYNIDFYERHPIHIIKKIYSLNCLVKEQKVDIIHCHWRFTTVYAQILHILNGVDVIWQNHLVPIPDGLLYRMTTFYGKRAVAISMDGFRFLHQNLKIPMDRISIVNNGINVDKYHRISESEIAEKKALYGVKPTEKVIVLFARLAEVKGHKFLLDAVKGLDIDYKVLFTGESEGEYKQDLERCIEKAGIVEKVVFTGTVTANEILSIADVMALPSRTEGFPISVLEAFALKVPVVRTKEGGYEDMADCVDGVEYGDVAGLTEALKRNLEFGVKVRQKVDLAYDMLWEKWDLERVVDSYLEIYRS